jgi:hypothetical protein
VLFPIFCIYFFPFFLSLMINIYFKQVIIALFLDLQHGTQSVQDAFPRRAWERENYSRLLTKCRNSFPRSAWECILDALRPVCCTAIERPRNVNKGRRASHMHSHAERGNECELLIYCTINYIKNINRHCSCTILSILFFL